MIDNRDYCAYCSDILTDSGCINCCQNVSVEQVLEESKALERAFLTSKMSSSLCPEDLEVCTNDEFERLVSVEDFTCKLCLVVKNLISKYGIEYFIIKANLSYAEISDICAKPWLVSLENLTKIIGAAPASEPYPVLTLIE